MVVRAEPTRFYAKRGRLLLFAAGSLVLAAAGGWLLASFGILGRVVGVLAVAFFGLTAAFFLRELAWRRPTLQIDAEGIVDRSTALPAGRVRWKDISGVRVFRSGRQHMLGIVLRDPAGFATAARGPQRFLMRTNTRMGHPEVAVPRSALPVPFESVIAEMRRHHPRLAVHDD